MPGKWGTGSPSSTWLARHVAPGWKQSPRAHHMFKALDERNAGCSRWRIRLQSRVNTAYTWRSIEFSPVAICLGASGVAQLLHRVNSEQAPRWRVPRTRAWHGLLLPHKSLLVLILGICHRAVVEASPGGRRWAAPQFHGTGGHGSCRRAWRVTILVP